MNVLMDITNHTLFIKLVRGYDHDTLFSLLHLWPTVIIIDLKHTQTFWLYLTNLGCPIINYGHYSHIGKLKSSKGGSTRNSRFSLGVV